MNGLVGTLLAGGGTLLAILCVVWLMFRGGAGRVGILVGVAAGSVLGFAGVLWNVVEVIVRAGGQALDAILRAATTVGVIVLGGWFS